MSRKKVRTTRAKAKPAPPEVQAAFSWMVNKPGEPHEWNLGGTGEAITVKANIRRVRRTA